MTTRRSFIKGGFAVAVAAAIPGSDGVVLDSSAHPYNYKTYHKGFVIARRTLEDAYIDVGTRMHAALARSMMQTKENVAARIWWDLEREYLHVDGVTAEEFYADDSKPLSRTFEVPDDSEVHRS